jgi:muconolactone D-isomerase
MLICTRMHVNIPKDMPADQLCELRDRETARAQDLQRTGRLIHLWRVAGKMANVSIWQIADADEFHEVLTSLPLFQYMDIEVIPLAKHPSSLQ